MVGTRSNGAVLYTAFEANAHGYTVAVAVDGAGPPSALRHLYLVPTVWAALAAGARLLEAYPVDKAERSHPDTMFFGAKSMYDRAGFDEVARRKPTRPVVRRTLRPAKS